MRRGKVFAPAQCAAAFAQAEKCTLGRSGAAMSEALEVPVS